MAGPRTQFSVGLLVLAGAVLLVGFVLFLTADRLRSGDALFETYTRESVQGLEVGSPVRYRGVQIGRVAGIALAAAEYRRPAGENFAGAFQLVVVRFTVDLARTGDIPSTEGAVAAGLRTRLATQGLTGVTYIELDFVDPDRFPAPSVPWQPIHPVIPNQPSTAAQVQTAAETLLRRLEGVPVEEIVANLNGVLLDIRSRLESPEADALLRESAALLQDLRGQVDQAQIPAAIGELRGAAAGVRGLAEGREVRALLAELTRTTQELRRVAQSLGPTVGRVNATVGDVQADLAPILRDLRAATSNLRETTEALRRSPSQALLGAPPPVPAR